MQRNRKFDPGSEAFLDCIYQGAGVITPVQMHAYIRVRPYDYDQINSSKGAQHRACRELVKPLRNSKLG